MQKDKFKSVAVSPASPKWNQASARSEKLYSRFNEVRDEFSRDYTRILHCTAYRRLKHKTQVFSATRNDHICTRIEHVNHVASVSQTISAFLGLNTSLASAIATGHDLGHPPFGHSGEHIIAAIAKKYLDQSFWHEKNGLYAIDCLETLKDPRGFEKNLNLTYAVRDGIISHCGEVDENAIFAREEAVELETIDSPGRYQPYTWEGCVVKISDKISYLGRDIEDALTLNILTKSQLSELGHILKDSLGKKAEVRELNNTVLMHDFIMDLCRSSAPDKGIRFSPRYLELINRVKQFNYKNIYFHKRLANYIKYADLVLNSIFTALKDFYKAGKTLAEIQKNSRQTPLLVKSFEEWILKYSNSDEAYRRENKLKNKILYNLSCEKDYIRAVIDFMACMTDHFAISVFNELISF
ncbi:MAG TPA: HD domain-containing protein [Candidatus Wallbacteria bacterium]|nr:HD domain-containing protein [Candidatus Wallbacteria bacterium]